MSKQPINIEDYLNVELVDPQSLAGKQIRGVFTPTNNSFLFIVTEDNKMVVYKVKAAVYDSPFSCTCEGQCAEEEAVHGIYEVIEQEELLDIILYNQDDFFFKKFNIFKDKEGLESELERRESLENEAFIQKQREANFQQYLMLQKEFQELGWLGQVEGKANIL